MKKQPYKYVIMKKQNLFIVYLIIMILPWVMSYCFYRAGFEKGKELQDETANRYFETFGNPSTQEQQCKFDYVVYNDSTECK